MGGGLIEEGDDAVAEDEGHEGVEAGDEVLDGHGGDVFEAFGDPGGGGVVVFSAFAGLHSEQPFEFVADDVEEQSDPDEGVAAAGVVVDGADP